MPKTKGIWLNQLKSWSRLIPWFTVISGVGYFLLAFFFYGSGLLAPLHMPLALVFMFLGVRSFYKVYWKRRIRLGIAYIQTKTWQQIWLHRFLVLTTLFIIMGGYVFVSLVPNDKDVFRSASLTEIEVRVQDDTRYAAQLVDMLTVTGNSLLLSVDNFKNNPSPNNEEDMRQSWNDFLGVAIASEEVTDIHRYFPQISVFRERPLQAQSFAISYSLYMLKFEYFHRLIEAVGLSQGVRLVLNEYSSAFGGTGSYNDVADRFFATNSFLRRNVGYIYYLIMSPDLSEIDNPEYKILLTVAKNSRSYLLKNTLSHLTHRGVIYSQSFNDGITGAWLPIQKTVFIDTIGNIRISDRQAKFITIDDINQMRPSLNPGDIFVARKNWYASNVGIPGFWTHAGLYTGSLDDMRLYFSEVFPFSYQGVMYESFDDVLVQLYPEVLAAYSSTDSLGFVPAVIESETKGVNVNSLEYAATVDYFGVMRPNLEKSNILIALLRAFSHYNKSYDYQFSLLTKDEIFCSELIHDAYIPMTDRPGIILPTRVVSGMELVAPNDMVGMFARERGQLNAQFSFVYFLDGRESLARAEVAGEAAFAASHLRPKFSFLHE